MLRYIALAIQSFHDLQEPLIAKGISAMFCGSPARGEQNGIKSNGIHSAIIESLNKIMWPVLLPIHLPVQTAARRVQAMFVKCILHDFSGSQIIEPFAGAVYHRRNLRRCLPDALQGAGGPYSGSV